MTERHILIVLSTPVPGEEDRFEAGYTKHLQEIVDTPGVVSGQRYWASEISDMFTPDWMRANSPYREAKIPFTHLAIYEIEGEIPESFKSMEHSTLTGIDPPELREHGWAGPSLDYGEVASWLYTVHGPRVGAV